MESTFQRKEIKSAGLENQVMAGYFNEIKDAMENKTRKIAWCTSVGPAELLRGMGFLVYFPENHGAMLGATKMSTALIDSVTAQGYKPTDCSYMTSDIGAYLNNVTPLAKAYGYPSVPRPDVLVYNTGQCRDVEDWFEWYGREFNVPVFGMHTPRDLTDDDNPYLHAEATRQLRAMVEPLEKISGSKLDMDLLKQVVETSQKTSQLWNECLAINMNKPAPWTFFDSCIHMGPAVVMRGMESANVYYLELLKELKEKVQAGSAAVDGEKHRLFWAGMPVWGKISSMSRIFGSLKANVVASTYCSSWIFNDLDPEKPFESLGKVYSELYIAGGAGRKERVLQSFFDQFSIDGVIYHDAWTCPFCNESRYGMPLRLNEKNGLPYIVIDGDLNDLRCFSEEQSRTKIEALIEELEGF